MGTMISGTMNDAVPAGPEPGTTSTTSLVQWTAIPVLPSRGQPHGKTWALSISSTRRMPRPCGCTPRRSPNL